MDELRKQLDEPNWTNLLKYLHENYYGKIILMDDFTNCLDKYDPTGECSAHLIKMSAKKEVLINGEKWFSNYTFLIYKRNN